MMGRANLEVLKELKKRLILDEGQDEFQDELQRAINEIEELRAQVDDLECYDLDEIQRETLRNISFENVRIIPHLGGFKVTGAIRLEKE